MGWVFATAPICVPFDSEMTASNDSPALPMGCADFTVEAPRERSGGVIRATDFGLSTANTNNAFAINRAVDEARRTGARRVELAPGTYRCFGETVLIEGLTDFVFDGQGAELVFYRPAKITDGVAASECLRDANFLIRNCERTRVGNFKMDWDWDHHPLATLVRVADVHVGVQADDSSYLDLELLGYSAEKPHPEYGSPIPVMGINPMDLQMNFVPGERSWIGNYEGHYGPRSMWLGPNRLRLWPKVKDPTQHCHPLYAPMFNPKQNLAETRRLGKIGATYRLIHGYAGKGGINMDSNRHLTLSDVTIWSCYGMALIIHGTQQYWRVENVSIEPKDATRPISSTADGMHVANSLGFAQYVNFKVKRNHDDAFNFHDCFTLGKKDGARRVSITHPRKADYARIRKGDDVELVEAHLSRSGFTAKVVDRDESGTWLEFDRDIPKERFGWFNLCNRSVFTHNVYFRNCTFDQTQHRGCIAIPDVTFENCRFTQTVGDAIRFYASSYTFETYCEGTASGNYIVRNCTFERNNPCEGGYTQKDNGADIASISRLPWQCKDLKGASSSAIMDILIEGCTFIDPYGPIVDLRLGSGIVFRNNVFRQTGRRVPKTPNTDCGRLRFENCREITCSGNRVVLASGRAAEAAESEVVSLGDLKMWAPQVRIYRLEGDVRDFTAVVGFDPSVRDLKWPNGYTGVHLERTMMAFRLYADGRKVADSGLLTPLQPSQVLRADVHGAKVVILESVDGGYWLGKPQLRALWKDVRFTRGQDGAVREDTSGALTPQLGILTPPCAAEPRINGPARFGVRPSHPVLYRVPVTGEGPLEITAENLPSGVSFDGTTRLLTGSVPKAGEYRILLGARNRHGSVSRELVLVIGDKICLTPPMGWSAWNAWRVGITDKIIRETADKLVESGLADVGFTYVNMDDGWQRSTGRGEGGHEKARKGPVRDADGRIRPSDHFPDMKGLADYLHSFGLRFGVYSSPGPETCARYEGSYGHEELDVETWASWGADFIKYDWCSYGKILVQETKGREPTQADRRKPFAKLHAAICKQPRDIVFSFSGASADKWGDSSGANLYRTWFDLKDSWGCVLEAAKATALKRKSSHAGFWADPDMLVVGLLNTGVLGLHRTLLTPNEQYSHLTMWSLLNAPLILGCRMYALDEFTLNLLRNPEVIEIDQDAVLPPARMTKDTEDVRILVKELSDGGWAVGVINLLPFKRTVTLDFRTNGLPRDLELRDVWRHRALGRFEGVYSAEVPPHAPLFLRARTVPCATCD